MGGSGARMRARVTTRIGLDDLAPPKLRDAAAQIVADLV
jgi:hypothetical protein